MCMQHHERQGMTHRTKDLFQCFLGSKWSISLDNGYKFALNPQVPDSQANTVFVKGGAGKESNQLYHSELVCYLPVPNIPAGKPQGKGAVCCIYSGWAFSLIAPSGSSTGNIQVRTWEAEESVQQHAQELCSSLLLLMAQLLGTPSLFWGVQGLYQGVQKGCSLWTVRTLWQHLYRNWCLPLLKPQQFLFVLPAVCLLMAWLSAGQGVTLPASSLCSSDAWGFVHTWPFPQLCVPVMFLLGMWILFDLLSGPFFAFKSATDISERAGLQPLKTTGRTKFLSVQGYKSSIQTQQLALSSP